MTDDDNLLVYIFIVLMCLFYLWHYIVDTTPMKEETNENSK